MGEEYRLFYDTNGESHSKGRIFRVVRDTNPVANPSGKNTPPLKASGKKPAFGDLDENQEYFHYEEYSNEVEDCEDDGKTNSGSDPNSVTIIVLSTIAAVLAVFGIVAFGARKYGWYDKIRKRPDPHATEAGSEQLEPLKRNV